MVVGGPNTARKEGVGLFAAPEPAPKVHPVPVSDNPRALMVIEPAEGV